MNGKLRPRLVFGARLALAAAIITLVVRSIGWTDVMTPLRQARPGMLATGILLVVPFSLLKAQRWRLLLGATGVPQTQMQALRILLAGQGVGAITPARVGEVSRVLFLPEGARARGVAVTFIDRCFDVLSICLLSLPGAIYFFSWYGGLMIGALAAASAAGIVLPRLAPLLPTRVVAAVERRFPGVSTSTRFTPRVLAVAMVWSALAYAAGYAIAFFFVLAFQSVSFTLGCLVFPLVTITNILPLTPGGLGVREGAAALLFEMAHLSPGVGVLAYLLMYVLMVALPGVLGMLWASLVPMQQTGAVVANADRLPDAMAPGDDSLSVGAAPDVDGLPIGAAPDVDDLPIGATRDADGVLADSTLEPSPSPADAPLPVLGRGADDTTVTSPASPRASRRRSSPSPDIWRPPSIEFAHCCHCGMCTGACTHGSLHLDENAYPALTPGSEPRCGFCDMLCPGREIDFTALERQFIDGPHRDPFAGRYQTVWLGRDPDDEAVLRSSSGGVVSALVAHALKQGLADVSVGAHFKTPTRTAPLLVRTAEDIEACRQSKYQVTAVCDLLKDVPADQRIIFVGTGCQVAAVRMLQARNRKWRDRIPYVVGVFCATGNQEPEAVDFLLRAMNVRPEEVESFSFRHGRYPGCARAVLRDGTVRTLSKDAYKWLYVLFTEERCMSCHDLPNLLADVSMGDPFDAATDPIGQSAVLVRTQRGQSLIESAVAAGRLRLEPLAVDRLVAAQAMAFQYARWGARRRLTGRSLPRFTLPDDDGDPPPPPLATRLHIVALQTVFKHRRLLRRLFKALPPAVFRTVSRWSSRG